jgi:hypothetical protein
MGSWRTLLKQITNKFKFQKKTEDGFESFINKDKRFLISIIKGKEHIFPALKHMLFQKRS